MEGGGGGGGGPASPQGGGGGGGKPRQSPSVQDGEGQSLGTKDIFS